MKLTLRIILTSIYVFLAVVFAPLAVIIVILMSIPEFWRRLRKHKSKKQTPAPASPFPGPVSIQPQVPIAGAASQTQARTQAQAVAQITADDWNHIVWADMRREGHA